MVTGRVVSWFGTCTDIHEQKMHEDSERLLSEASRVLASSFDLSSTLPTIASMLASWFHGYCIIDLLRGDRSRARRRHAHGRAGSRALLDEMRAFAPRDNRASPLWRVIESRTPEICNDVTDQLLTATSMSDRHLNVAPRDRDDRLHHRADDRRRTCGRHDHDRRRQR